MSGYYAIDPRKPESPYVFGPDFFKRKFPEYMRKVCDISGKTAALEIVLTSGQTLDVAYFDEIDDEYMLLAVFVDTRDCRELYSTYVRYDAVYQVNVVQHDEAARKLGFNIDHKPRVAEVGSIGFKPGSKRDQPATKTAARATNGGKGRKSA